MNKLTENLLNEREKEKFENIKFIVTCALLMILFTIFTVANSLLVFYVKVSGQSMMNTLNDGDVLAVSRYADFGYGDIIIIRGEKGANEYIIKRVIGLPGDTIVIENGNVYRNGVKLNEPYALGATYFENENPSRKEYFVSENNVFYLGDNRLNSRDSRSDFSTCDYSQVEGVVYTWSLYLRPLTSLLIGGGKANDNKVGD